MKDMFIKISLQLGGCLTPKKSYVSGRTMKLNGGGREGELRN